MTLQKNYLTCAQRTCSIFKFNQKTYAVSDEHIIKYGK